MCESLSRNKRLESIAREFSENSIAAQARIDLLKARLVDHLKSVGQVKVTERNTVSWQHNGGVVPIEIVDAEEIPARCRKLVPSNTLVSAKRWKLGRGSGAVAGMRTWLPSSNKVGG